MAHGSTYGQKGYCEMERLNMYLDMVMLAMVSHFRISTNTSIILVSGNLHLNIVADAYLPEIQEALEPYIYEVVGMSSSEFMDECDINRCVASHRGSISAEHGIGAVKAHALQYSKSSVSIELMKKLKDVFDPKGIMNPGKVLEM